MKVHKHLFEQNVKGHITNSNYKTINIKKMKCNKQEDEDYHPDESE
jgi:hypothetical protein